MTSQFCLTGSESDKTLMVLLYCQGNLHHCGDNFDKVIWSTCLAYVDKLWSYISDGNQTDQIIITVRGLYKNLAKPHCFDSQKFLLDCITAKTCEECIERRNSTEFHCNWCQSLERFLSFPVFLRHFNHFFRVTPSSTKFVDNRKAESNQLLIDIIYSK